MKIDLAAGNEFVGNARSVCFTHVIADDSVRFGFRRFHGCNVDCGGVTALRIDQRKRERLFAVFRVCLAGDSLFICVEIELDLAGDGLHFGKFVGNMKRKRLLHQGQDG